MKKRHSSLFSRRSPVAHARLSRPRPPRECTYSVYIQHVHTRALCSTADRAEKRAHAARTLQSDTLFCSAVALFSTPPFLLSLFFSLFLPLPFAMLRLAAAAAVLLLAASSHAARLTWTGCNSKCRGRFPSPVASLSFFLSAFSFARALLN